MCPIVGRSERLPAVRLRRSRTRPPKEPLLPGSNDLVAGPREAVDDRSRLVTPVLQPCPASGNDLDQFPERQIAGCGDGEQSSPRLAYRLVLEETGGDVDIAGQDGGAVGRDLGNPNVIRLAVVCYGARREVVGLFSPAVMTAVSDPGHAEVRSRQSMPETGCVGVREPIRV